MYQLVKTEIFEKKFNKLIPEHLKENTKHIIKGLRGNPVLGKPLSFRFIREIKIEKFRIYYMVYEEEVIVLLITVSDKRLQGATIKSIKKQRKKFKQFVKNYLKEGNCHDNDEENKRATS